MSTDLEVLKQICAEYETLTIALKPYVKLKARFEKVKTSLKEMMDEMNKSLLLAGSFRVTFEKELKEGYTVEPYVQKTLKVERVVSRVAEKKAEPKAKKKSA